METFGFLGEKTETSGSKMFGWLVVLFGWLVGWLVVLVGCVVLCWLFVCLFFKENSAKVEIMG